MTTTVIRRGLAVAVASLAVTGIFGGMAGTASANPVPGCNSRSYPPSYTVRHLHQYGNRPAATICKAYKHIGGGKYQVFYKIKGQGAPAQVQVLNDGTLVRTYFVRGETGTIKGRFQGHSSFFRTCRPNGTKCGPWQ